MRKIVKTFVLLCFLLLTGLMRTTPAHAADPTGDVSDPDPSMPIDGGLSILLAAGAGYGIKKYHSEQKRKKEKQSNQSLL